MVIIILKKEKVFVVLKQNIYHLFLVDLNMIWLLEIIVRNIIFLRDII